jgi:Tol biopolymer transport system component
LRSVVSIPAICVVVLCTSPLLERHGALCGTEGLPRPAGEYLGQKPPGMEPVMFAPGIVSTPMDELNSVFSPDGNLFLFSLKMPDRRRHTILFMEQKDGIWSEPAVAPFSGLHNDADPAISPDGQKIYFISKRPIKQNDRRSDWDIWVVDRVPGGWGEPQHLPKPVNTERLEVYPSITQNGTLYFSSGRGGGLGKNDIYRAEFVDGQFAEPENLGEAINSEYNEGDLFVAPDESYIIFVSSDRQFAFGNGDLYISFKMDDGSWAKAKNMGKGINTEWLEYCPVVSPDGKYLFFTSYRPTGKSIEEGPRTFGGIREIYGQPGNGLGDIYWVDAKVIDKFRAE